MGCGCNKSSTKSYTNPNLPASVPSFMGQSTEVKTMANDAEFVMVQYLSANRGQHRVIGTATKTVYGHRGGGERFLVHRDDVKSQPHLFQIIANETKSAPRKAPTPPAPKQIVTVDRTITPPPTFIKTERPSDSEPIEEAVKTARFDVGALPGVTPAVEKGMAEAHLDNPEAILRAGIIGLTDVKGIGEAKAQLILQYVKDRYAA